MGAAEDERAALQVLADDYQDDAVSQLATAEALSEDVDLSTALGDITDRLDAIEGRLDVLEALDISDRLDALEASLL